MENCDEAFFTAHFLSQTLLSKSSFLIRELLRLVICCSLLDAASGNIDAVRKSCRIFVDICHLLLERITELYWVTYSELSACFCNLRGTFEMSFYDGDTCIRINTLKLKILLSH